MFRLAVFLSFLVLRVSCYNPEVTISNGTLHGLVIPSMGQEAFLDIPYAQSIAGENRLMPSKPLNTSWDAPLNATSWGKACPGGTNAQFFGVEEDCLHINIIRPEGVSDGDELPVLLWIYGGNWYVGSATDPRFNGSYIVQRSVELGKPIIFVSINYRLSVFGFPLGEESANASILNLGIRDQRLALQWLQDNISAFGGSPKKVTIWGESVGGISATIHMAAYGGRNEGLFRAAIVDSGVFSIRNASVTSQAGLWNSLLETSGCNNSSDTISCLRSMSFDDLYAATLNVTYWPLEVPDHDLIEELPYKALQDGNFFSVPVIVGNNKDEATFGFNPPLGVNDEDTLRQGIAHGFADLNPSNVTIDKLLSLYPNIPSEGCPYDTGEGVLSSGLMDKRSYAIWTDSIVAGTRHLLSRNSLRSPSWSYRFHQLPQNGTMEAGVGHFQELPYIFGVLERTQRTPLGNRPGGLETSKLMQTYWINFVHDLDPNDDNVSIFWPSYVIKNPQNIVFVNNRTQVLSDTYRKEKVQFLRDIALGRIKH
ncbi:alpha/beta-hydrolase [Armillaria fumosa]|nr:alpha/beta-hydrolase [Armillaria fumosa]